MLSRLILYLFVFISCISLLSACLPPTDATLGDRQLLWMRTDWSTASSVSSALNIATELYIENLDRPVNIAPAADGSGRLFILEQEGKIRIIQHDHLLPEAFLDISDEVSCCGEQGLLGFAADPDFVSNGRFFISYTDLEGHNVIARYLISNDPNRAEPRSKEIVLRVAQPGTTHNGGHIAFGPDGYLYVAIGDGSVRDRPLESQEAQDLRTHLGKLLRLDINQQPYGIPRSNPFTQEATHLPEIWALGLRNPWRFSIDEPSGLIYIADVGQSAWEEVNVITLEDHGSNFAWPLYEGVDCQGQVCEGQEQPPVLSYGHDEGCSITGGLVYRGDELEELYGAYLFADFCFGKIWAAAQVEGQWQRTLLFNTAKNISSFGSDEAGEIYFTDYGRGSLYKIVEIEPDND